MFSYLNVSTVVDKIIISFQVNNQAQNNNISTFINEKHFCQGCDWFIVCYPRRRKSNGVIFGSFRTYRKMAAVVEVSCSEFDSSVFSFRYTNCDKFPQVLIIMNGLGPFQTSHFSCAEYNANEVEQ